MNLKFHNLNNKNLTKIENIMHICIFQTGEPIHIDEGIIGQ